MSLSGEDWSRSEKRSRTAFAVTRAFLLGALLSFVLFTAAAGWAGRQMSSIAEEQKRSRERSERQDKATLQLLKALDPDHADQLDKIMHEPGR